jgi:anti-sigma factor (TIGR02949 family)
MSHQPPDQEHGHEHGKDPLCLEIFARLSAYLDGELPAEDCAGIEAHIADCPPCVEFLKDLRNSVEAAHRFKVPAAPAPLDTELRIRLSKAWSEALARKSAGAGPA